ncbi:two component AraC family transcriptional regulator (plasmid) [Calothrix sp. PCC 7716]|nr:two component AraC family transcriptional regulator [Calothrix sp. PCC 7716]
MKENCGIEEAKSETRGILECINRILELDVEDSKAIGAKNSQADYQQTQEKFPILIICDTKMLETDNCDILTALYKINEVAIITLSSLIGDATTDKYLSDFSKLKKLLLQNAAKLESQINLSQKGAQNQQYLEISLDETVKPSTTKSIFPSIPKLNDIFDFIEAHYHQPISSRDVAQSVGYSAAYLTNLAQRETGQSLHRWITKRRMVAACSLLLDSDLSIDCIAEAVGYCNRWCFFRNFRNSFGTTPGDWRSEARDSVTKTCGDIA